MLISPAGTPISPETEEDLNVSMDMVRFLIPLCEGLDERRTARRLIKITDAALAFAGVSWFLIGIEFPYLQVPTGDGRSKFSPCLPGEPVGPNPCWSIMLLSGQGYGRVSPATALLNGGGVSVFIPHAMLSKEDMIASTIWKSILNWSDVHMNLFADTLIKAGFSMAPGGDARRQQQPASPDDKACQEALDRAEKKRQRKLRKSMATQHKSDPRRAS